MKLCSEDKKCPYQGSFDVLWKLEAIDPGLCEGFLSKPDSKCLLKKPPQVEMDMDIEELRAREADLLSRLNRLTAVFEPWIPGPLTDTENFRAEEIEKLREELDEVRCQIANLIENAKEEV